LVRPYINPQSTGRQSLRAVRWATVWFSILMIIVASTTSYLIIVHQTCASIPIVLGIFGYTYGSLLGVFLCGMFTKRRGNDLGNIIAMIVGFIVVMILSVYQNKIAGLLGGKLYTQPSWLPVMEFPWWICFGTIVRFPWRLCSEPAGNITHRVRLSDNGPQGRGYRFLQVQAEIDSQSSLNTRNRVFSHKSELITEALWPTS